MSTQSFKVKSGLTISPVDLTTLTNPQAGDLACDINDSNKIKRYDAASSSWTEVGSGAAGDVDTLLVQDFDSASISTFSAPNGSQVGLELITTNPLDGRQSARLVHDVPITGVTRSFKQIIAVAPKYRGVNMTASLLLRSSASQGNVTIQFRDETNSVDYPSQQLQTNSQVIASLVTNSTTLVSGFSNSNINTLKVGMSVTGSGIPTGTTIASINSSALTITLSQAATASATVSLRFSDLPRTIQLGFNIPANCSSYSYTISALQEAGSPETYVDDIVLKNYWIGMSNQGQSEILVPSIEQQNIIVVPSSNVTNSNILGSPLTSVGSGLFSYNSVTGVYTVLKQSNFNLHMSGRTTTAATSAFQIFVDEINVSQMDTVVGSGYEGNASYSAILNAGSTFRFYCGGSPSNSAETRSSVSATAITTSSVIVNDLVPSKAVLGNTSLEIPSITGWQGYTPTFQGFGSPTNIEFEWRQVGENVEIRGKFTSGAATAVEARVGLPAGLTSAGTSLIPSTSIFGRAERNITTATSSKDYTIICGPSQQHLNFSIVEDRLTFNPNTPQLGNAIIGNGEILTLRASVPCAGLSATEEVVVSGTQSALVQEADSMVRVNTGNGYGSTATRILRFSNITQSLGTDISYVDSATNGGSFTVQSSGIYSINFNFESTTVNQYFGISKNASSLTTVISGLALAERLAMARSSGTANYVQTTSWEGYLNAGDIIRAHTDGATIGGNPSYIDFTIAKQGSLKQLNVSSDQKITIPTSELRFEGASSRGSTATAIVKFDTLAKLRGDAFTVESDAVLGTRITMLKAGKLDVSSSIYSTAAGQQLAITKNSSTLVPATVFNVASELLSTEYTTGTSDVLNVSYSGYVSVGDIIRIAANVAMVANPSNNLNLSFQEQDISVSVTNTLPQFSESDSSVRVDTANGYGSTATRTMRFSNIRENLGSDITYSDSSTDGSIVTIQANGLYSISLTASFNISNTFGIIKNGVGSTDPQSQVTSSILALEATSTANNQNTCSWSGYLQQGDVIRSMASAAAPVGSNNKSVFTISKVGKPNVTGVDVTPFVNVPQPKTQSSLHVAGAITANSIVTSLTSFSAVDSGVYSVNTTTGIYTVLKPANFTISYSSSASGAASITGVVVINSIDVAVDTTAPAVNNFQNAVWTGLLNAGDTFWARSANNASSNQKIIVSATALSDQILTAPETFSTDTAALQYSSTYTLSTLQNAPVGTYITFTYAANTNTRTQTSTRPTQTDADMNANGLLVYTRAYNAPSTATQPAAFAIQIGKGLKGRTLDLYKSSGKVTPGSIDFTMDGASELGFNYKSYNELTGILLIDAGISQSGLSTSHGFMFSDATGQTSGYLVINASKNPALTGMNIERVSARAFNSAGTSIPSASNTTITYSGTSFDTHGAFNTSTGVFTAPETGYYQINGAIGFANSSWTASQIFDIYFLKNGITFSTKRQVMPTISESSGTNLSDIVYLLKSDTVTMQVRHTRGVATTLEAAGTYNYLSIAKVNIGKGN